MPASPISCSASWQLQRRIVGANYRAPERKRSEVLSYYSNALGMVHSTTSASSSPDGQALENMCFSHAPGSTQLNFRFVPAGGDGRRGRLSSMSPCVRVPLYWKIGLAVDDVDASLARLGAAGVIGAFRRGGQFRDIGFLQHIKDPLGHPIELLQTTFEGNHAGKAALEASRPAQVPPSPLTGGSDPVVGQITTRTKDPRATVDFYTKVMGMTLLEKQDVVGFDLYFFAYHDPAPETLPTTAAKREWMYQLPITTLEVQHVHDLDPKGPRLQGPSDVDETLPAFEGMSVAVSQADLERISAHPTFDASRRCVSDPDGLSIDLQVLPPVQFE